MVSKISESREDLIFKDIEESVKNALNSSSVDIGVLNSTVNYIHSLDVKKRQKYKAIYYNIGADLFELGIYLPQHNNDFFNITVQDSKTEKKLNSFDSEKDFDEKIEDFLESFKKELDLLSRCFLFKFGDDKNLGFSYLLLHDSHSKTSLHAKINSDFHKNCKLQEINEFISELKTNQIRTTNYIALLTISSHINPDETVLKELEDIGKFLSVEQITLLPESDNQNQWRIEPSLDNICKEIKYLVSKDLRDIDISASVEKVLKKMFSRDNNHILRYKKISVGFSGAMVFQIEPTGLYYNSLKFIIKIGASTETRHKIVLEESNVYKYVITADPTYKIDLEITEHCTAIKYNYASKNTKISSKSFNKKIGDSKINDDELISNIESLFNIDLMLSWKNAKNVIEISFESSYKEFVNVKRFYEKIAQIYDVDIKNIEEVALVKIFNLIKDFKFSSFKKTCHGDLHSDNFFIDEEHNVFLIDFGDTGELHALIDYATLECSVKFRHVPRYIDYDELIKIEKKLLNMDSFKESFEYEVFNRKDLMRPFSIIKKIRQQVLKDKVLLSEESILEYLYSLFMITIRQISYENLNQLYAIKSAEVIGEEIIRLKKGENV